ncbi:sulfur carrier protein ThiS [Novispirillum sp. DQ9]|uniref:sulfur carrier protein ThiS n=1 Tax=Novispirillum sp. DQ9 TaxID=3398612 RepID=UPI003C7DDDB2
MPSATLKLYSVLAKHLPAGAEKNMAAIPVGEATTVGSLIAAFNLPPQHCHLVLLNGVFVPPEARDATPVRDGDAVAIWPPVAGG